MLWTIFVILAAMWLLGMVSSYTMGGAVHVLLVLAVIVLLFNLLGGRGVLDETKQGGASGRPFEPLWSRLNPFFVSRWLRPSPLCRLFLPAAPVDATRVAPEPTIAGPGGLAQRLPPAMEALRGGSFAGAIEEA